jgi:hypothetical protein
MLALTADQWEPYAQVDKGNGELAYPPLGHVKSFDNGVATLPEEIKARFKGAEPFPEQSDRCQAAIKTLVRTLADAKPDFTVIISDDQDEWFYEDNMPMFSVYWGDTVRLEPRRPRPGLNQEIQEAIRKGYGDVSIDIPVPSRFGRFLIEYLAEHDFDPAHMTHARPSYGGKVARRYPTPDGELSMVKETPEHEQGLPHGFSFVVKRLFENEPGPILPVFQNTCYPPNQPSPRRSYLFGKAVADAVRAWPEKARVAIVCSGGLSHFVVDEELDRAILGGLEKNDAHALQNISRTRLFSAASESLNWIAMGGAMSSGELKFNLVDYVPVYRTPAGTGGGWAFARWQ